MTLITYPTRVHFADDVVEEALHSELERAGAKHPLLIGPAELDDTEARERVLAGFPRFARPECYSLKPTTGFAEAMRSLHQKAETEAIDAIVAFGSARSLTLGQKCRAELSDATGKRLPLHVIPNIDGLPDPGTLRLETWRNALPDVVICDPTMADGAGGAAHLRALIVSFVRCLEAYLAPTYNPVADGLALDGIQRCVDIIPKLVTGKGEDLRRETMVATLNAAMSQEKGPGPTQQIVAALSDVCPDLDQAAALRLVLPGALTLRPADPKKRQAVLRIIGRKGATLDEAVGGFLAQLPLPNALAALGIGADDLTRATTIAETRFGLSAARLSDMLMPLWQAVPA
ncbi:MAG: iron-containing alcohol dehydrogenase [Tabrizicola sp.]|nr:iron-containing alcohol dehydrogenase [Tabrizicola sp.]